MKGLVLKDLIFLRSNMKTLFITIVAIFIMSLSMTGMNLAFMIPFVVIMLCLSTFSYDEFNKWDGYALTLPVSKKTIVKSKYLFTLLVVAIAVLIGFLLGCLIGMFQDQFSLYSFFYEMMGTTTGLLFFITIIYPLMYKFGSQKGRTMIFIVVAVIFFIIFGMKQLLSFFAPGLDMSFLNEFFNTYGLYCVLVLAIIFTYVSYIISLKIYNKKEF